MKALRAVSGTLPRGGWCTAHVIAKSVVWRRERRHSCLQFHTAGLGDSVLPGRQSLGFPVCHKHFYLDWVCCRAMLKAPEVKTLKKKVTMQSLFSHFPPLRTFLALPLARQFVYFLTDCAESLSGLSPCLDKCVWSRRCTNWRMNYFSKRLAGLPEHGQEDIPAFCLLFPHLVKGTLHLCHRQQSLGTFSYINK